MAAPRQPELQRCRELRPSQTPPVQPVPVGAGPSSDPHITLSPQTPTGLRTVGFSFFLGALGDPPTAITIWKRDPISKLWAILLEVTPPDVLVFFWYTVCDVNASELFFQVVGNEEALAFVEEIGYGA